MVLGSSIHLARRSYHDSANEAKMQQEEGDELFKRLNRDVRAYALHNRKHLDLEFLDGALCRSLFRFTYPEMRLVSRVLGFPKHVSFRSGTPQRFSLDRTFAFAIMLRRLAYHSKLKDLELLFGMNKSTIGVVYNTMLTLLYEFYHEGIRFNEKHLHPFNLIRFANATKLKGSLYENVIGFIDETLIGVAKPVRDQDIVYNEHAKCHGLKYQGIVTPDGITASLSGPFPGSDEDQDMSEENNLMEELKDLLDPDELGGEQYAIYGEPAHGETTVLIKPFRSDSQLSEVDNIINYEMSTLQSVVEWEFENVASLFPFVKYRPGQKVLLSRCAYFYTVATLMKNIHICLNGGQSSEHFNLYPPTLEEYIDQIKPDN